MQHREIKKWKILRKETRRIILEGPMMLNMKSRNTNLRKNKKESIFEKIMTEFSRVYNKDKYIP